jgi:pimeloyl-ACP methyl ester carboxylesterase
LLVAYGRGYSCFDPARSSRTSVLSVIRRVAVLLLCLFVLPLEACGSAQNQREAIGAATPAPRTRNPTLTPRDCGVDGLAVPVDCSWLTVPMNRRDHDGEKVRLAVAVIRSLEPKPASDPIVFLEGGPGADNIAANLAKLAQPRDLFLQSRDVVVFDQRGTGMSEPRLDCQEIKQARVQALAQARPYATQLEDRQRAARQCRERLQREGVDLNHFDTENSAADLADLRIALGVRSWNLFARSYGTRLALTAMRSHPEGIRSAVLDSVYPPTTGRLDRLSVSVRSALATLSKACKADPWCRSQVPDLGPAVQSVVDQYDRVPFQGVADVGPPFGTVPAVVTGAGAFADLVNALANTGAIPTLPATVRALANGDPAALQQGVSAVTFLNNTAEGAFLSIECADSAQRKLTNRAKRLLASPGELGELVLELAEPYCPSWGVESLPSSFNRTVESDVPTLVLAGAFDPLTPVSFGKEVAKRLANATFVEFRASAHGVVNLTGTTRPSDSCVVTIVVRFVADPSGAVDTACAESVRVRFAHGAG